MHDDDIKGVSLRLDRPLDANKVNRWLSDLLATKGPDILRAKGILDVAGEDRRLVFQAVHMILEGDLQRPWTDADTRESRMVFIGRDLDEAALRAGFEACAAAGWPGCLRRGQCRMSDTVAGTAGSNYARSTGVPMAGVDGRPHR